MRLIKDEVYLLNQHKDDFALLVYFAVYLAAWTLCSAFLPISTEQDSVEQMVWSQSWQWGYYKHPPHPSALLHVLNLLFNGPSIGLAAFAAQSCSVVAMLYIWRLAKLMLPGKLAITAVLITSLIAYHNFRALTFNHNSASLPFTAAAMYYFYSALRNPERKRTWVYLGIVCGLAMLTKYSASLILTSFFVYLIWQRLWATTSVIRGILISSIVFLLVFSPHVFWLYHNNWLPLSYLQDELAFPRSRLSILTGFFSNQLIRLSFTLPLILGVWFLRKGGRIKVKSNPVIEQAGTDHDFRYLLSMQLTPIIFAIMPPLLSGSFLNSNWVSAFYLPAGLLVTKYFYQQLDETQLLKYANRLAWSTHAAILSIFFLASVIYPAETGRASRSNFPSQTLANKVSEIWYQHQTSPLAIVISDTWTGGNVMLHVRPEPTLLIDNDGEKSPWVRSNDIAACGAFIIIDARAVPEAYSEVMSQGSVKGEFVLEWGRPPLGKEIHYLWGIQTRKHAKTPCRFLNK